MSDKTLAEDYDPDDGFVEVGLEQCPHCEIEYSANGGHIGTVYDGRGREYDNYLDTDPMDGPFFCPDCWKELEANRKATENKTLTEWSE